MPGLKGLGLGAAALLLTAADASGPLTRDDYAGAAITHLRYFDQVLVIYGRSAQGAWSVRQQMASMVPDGACSLQVKLGDKVGGTGAPVAAVTLTWAQIVPGADNGMVVLRSGAGEEAARIELVVKFPGTEQALAAEFQALRVLCGDGGAAIRDDAVRDLDTMLMLNVETASMQQQMDDDFDADLDFAAYTVNGFDREACRLSLVGRGTLALALRGAAVRDENERIVIADASGAVKRIAFLADRRPQIVAALRAMQRSCAAA